MRYGTGAVDTNTAEDYFDAGMVLLAEGGPRALTVAAMCRRLAVTKGSFYHHFSGTSEFIRRLLCFWENHELRRTEEVAARAGAESPTELAKLAAAWGIRHEAETAIRALGRTDPFAADVQQRVDDARQTHLRLLFEHLGIHPERAEVLARLGIAVLIGTQQREYPVNRGRLEETLSEYQRWIQQTAGAGPALAPVRGTAEHRRL